MTESGRRSVEPVAIVGIGCRFPGGANDPDAFWSFLMQRRSGIRDVPPDRWNLDRYYHPDPGAAGAMVMRRGGFVDNLDSFDAAFWGISPREALRMDPQQRWLLEVAWEAIEDAGIAPRRLRGRRVGVFVGISGNDYGGLQLRSTDDVDAYTNSGSTASIASNRVSYLLDLRGPSLSLDTACSSSLVSVAAACESIWAGHCEAALAGGVNSLISPQTTVGFSKASMISPTGDCFAFDARANGFVRAEGAALVYLKPLSSALSDRDRIYAVIRSIAVNQDGHTSAMTVPGLDGQTAMLEDAYRQAGIDPAHVAYIEAHGTGTPVGDPIEAAALGRVVGRGRPTGSACLIGSVKTNIGHLESASGIAGLVKAALVLHHGTIPATLNHERPNPQIPFDDLRLAVVSSTQPLRSADGGPPIVAVNSFGFGGTNAHAVLEGAPQRDPAASNASRAAHRPYLLPVSARDGSALRAYVRDYRALLADSSTDIRDLCSGAGDRKEHHTHRLVISGRSHTELRKRAATWLRDGAAEGATSGRAGSAFTPVFVFAGQGPQWWAMGRQLLDREPVFRHAMLEVDAVTQRMASWSVLAEMLRPQSESRIDHTDIAQPAIFALQVALCELWKSWGIRPVKAIGHSVGEVAAAYCAGVYSLHDATRIIMARARLQHRAFGRGRMLAVALSQEEVTTAIGAVTGVEVAAVNSPRLMTLAGEVESLTTIEQQLQAAGVFTRWLRGQYAFHSAQMDPIRDEVLAALAEIRPAPARIPLVSTVTGRVIEGASLDAAYWWQNIRQAVLFGPAIARLIDDGDCTFLEISPHPVLESAIKECFADREQHGSVFHSLRRETDESDEIIANLAALYVAGADLDWRAVNQGSDRIVKLPRYPWRRESFWIESPESVRVRVAPAAHPLLGQRIESAAPTWQARLDLCRLPYLKDHRIWDSVLFPAAAYSEMGLALGRILFPDQPIAVENLEIVKALFVADGQATVLQTTFDTETRGFAIYSSVHGADAWELHARGTLARMTTNTPAPLDLEAIRVRLDERLDHEAYCRELDKRGFHFGKWFRQVRNLWRSAGEVLIEVEPPSEVARQGYVFHPAVQDACFHALIGFPTGRGLDEPPPLVLPQSVRRIRVYGNTAGRLWTHALNASCDGASLQADFFVCDDLGNRVADILGFRTQAIEQKHASNPLDNCYYQFTWEPRRLTGSGIHGSCRFASSEEIVNAVREALPGLEQQHRLDEYHRRFVPDAEATIALLAQRALVDLGWQQAPGTVVHLDTVIATVGIDADYRRVTRRLLRALERSGVLRNAGDDAWEVARVFDRSGAEDAIERLARDYPSCADEIELYRRTGLNLASILAGELDPLELLFPGGSQETIERFYSRALGFPAHLEAARLAIERAIAALPPGRSLRVLEVGAGTGVLTSYVLPVLPAYRTEYLFTDIGVGFNAAARKRFGDYPFIDYQVFDIETEPEAQRIPTGHFDLILGADVVHATADLRVSLRNLRRCVAPGGLLLLLELARPDFVRGDVTVGLLKGYSRFTDLDERPHSALALAGQWRRLMTDSGFENVASVDCFSDPAVSEHAIILGFAPADEAVLAACDPAGGSRFVIFADAGGMAAALARRLRESGHSALLVYAGHERSAGDGRMTIRPDADEDVRNVLATAGECAGVVHCWTLDRPDASTMTLDQLESSQSRGLMGALRLIRSLDNRSTPAWFLTRAAQQVGDRDLVEGLASTPLSGLLRVANNEQRCRFFSIDLDDSAPDAIAASLADEITLSRDGEFEIAYRDGIRYVPRLQRVRPDQLPLRTFNAVAAGRRPVAFQVQTHGPGILTNLALHETQRIAPGPEEVEVRVLAAGINFRDVMKALGTHPGNPEDLLWFGDDLSGIVERVGERVTAFQPGDEVGGMAPYAIRSYARTDARILFRKPPHLSFAEAAAIPTVFLTAHYAIDHLARMQPSESILIHAGTGGVGQAAVQVAKRLGLKIFATAGTPEKRALLTGMGVDRVMSSRTLEFADEIMEVTGGRGVDAVLNSLAGDFIPRSLSVLAPFGRFLEIGKVDIYRNTKIGLQPLRNNISYFVIDLTQHLRDRREFVVQMFREITAAFAVGSYHPVPQNLFPITEVADAFRFMAQGKHVGKNVLTFDHADIPVAFTTDSQHRFKAEATYLITGGAGGFGLQVAEWIARHGGRHIVLMSRSGPRDEDAVATIERMRADGITVLDARGDVSKPGDVAHIIDLVAKELPPLKGVFHGAMILDDGLIAELDERRVRAALDPKMAGAWNLHEATERLQLDHFVCFSSFSSVVGMIRQSNYNAGNAFLDSLARYRRARHLPALTVNWGVILGAGYVERTRNTAEMLARAGVGAFQTDEALRALDVLLVRDASQVAAARVDWNAVLKLSPLATTSHAYASVTRETRSAETAGSLISQLRVAASDEQEALLQKFIAAEVAGVFGAAADRIDRTARLTDLGLDSLMTLELTFRVERELGIRVPVGALMSGPTIAELAGSVRELLAPVLAAAEGPADDNATSVRQPAAPSDLADHIVIVKNGTGIPVFCFHPVGGGVGIYAALANHVPDDLPLYGVESRVVQGDAEYDNLQEMVDAYVAAVRAAHRGPYRLLGFSLGGYLAGRVAAVLEELGATVEFVGVLDWDARQQITPAAQRDGLVRLAVASYRFLQQEMGILEPRAEDRLRDEISALVDRIAVGASGGGEVFFEWVVENQLTTRGALEDRARQYLVRFEQHCRLLTQGLPQSRFAAPLIVWRARDGFGSSIESWDRGGTLDREHVFEGDHNALMRPAALERVGAQLVGFMHTLSGARRVEDAGAAQLA